VRVEIEGIGAARVATGVSTDGFARLHRPELTVPMLQR
jgi:hypothetical protein